MAGGLLGIGTTGLVAAQRALQTTSHNIANVNTEGFSRQRVETGTQVPMFQGGSYLGTGVLVTGVERIYDNFLFEQVHVANSSFNESEAFSHYASLMDEMLADQQTGLMPAVDNFFNAIQDLANNPASTTERRLMLANSETLVDRFQYINQRFVDVREQVNNQIASEVAEINTLANAIASINGDIGAAQNDPNDLLDERDRLITELSAHINLTTVEQDNGAVNVYYGKGQVLVIDVEARNVSAIANQYDSAKTDVHISLGGGTTLSVSDQITGGSLGGILNFRSQMVDDAQNSLGLLAIGMADSFNSQHIFGMDLDGAMGQNYFTVPPLHVLPGAGVVPTVSAALSDSNALTGDEYLLRYNGANSYTLTNNTDNTTTAIATGGAYPFTTTAIDGFSLTLAAGAVSGDTFLIQPTRFGAGELGLSITDPRKIAAAAPIRTSKTLANTGTAEISAGAVTNVASLPLPADVTLTYNSGANEFSVAGAVPGVANFTYVDGGTVTFNGLQFSITGSPADTDTFTISSNTSGVGDNRNALLMGGLLNTSTLLGSNASYDEVYSSIVADVGILAEQSNIFKESREALFTQAKNARDSLSGVNLDEEAANIVKFQQAYQASAQVINVSNEMFQTLLFAVRG